MSSGRLSACIVLPLSISLCLSTGGCGVPVAVSAASYAADGGLMIVSDKTSTDHLASMVTKQDCAMWRVLRGRRICKEREGNHDPYDVDYGAPQRSVSESGVQYAPPLRAPPDAPPTSWDASVYKTVPPTPEPEEEGPMTASADPPVAAPLPVQRSSAAAAAPVKPSKNRVARSVRKPSRGRVASAP